MICCDLCEDWFHGKCVGVTKSMGMLPVYFFKAFTLWLFLFVRRIVCYNTFYT
jgi:hypothetical protein